MPGWTYLILIGTLIVGLRQSVPPRNRAFTVVIVVVTAVAYAAWRQHAY